MRTPILFGAAALILAPVISLAASDYLLKLDGIDGETKPAPTRAAVEPVPARAVPTETTVAPPATGGTEAGSMYMKIEGVDGESKDDKKKMEAIQLGDGTMKPAPAPGVEPDEIDFKGEQETNFAILLQGPSTGDEEEKRKGLERAAAVILQHAQESGRPMESLSLNFTKIEYKMKSDAKLFGLIPMSVLATVEIDESETATVKLPWWSFLVTGVEREEIGVTAKATLSEILKIKRAEIVGVLENTK